MKVLVVGGGGREHALAWKLAASPQVSEVLVAPGNGGTDTLAKTRAVPVAANDLSGLLALARAEAVDLTVVGPEDPLAAGLVDLFINNGLRCFGPSAAAARLESSKAFAKAFMDEVGLPTARWARFHALAPAVAWLKAAPFPVVIKASGLAAGKGVVLPESMAEAESTLEAMLVGRSFGDAGAEVVIEERLAGPEVSVIGFCDGKTARVLPAARDHKRLAEGDRGPNTGGMGAVAPVTASVDLGWLEAEILGRAVEGMARMGTPFVGFLFAGLMLTSDGPKVLEFNCRLGDPETQVLLPLLRSDLPDLLVACLEGRLAGVGLEVEAGAAATVVMASGGYPGVYAKGLPISGIEDASRLPGVTVFHAGTARAASGGLVTAGGRVLSVTGVGDDLDEALARAYLGVRAIRFEGMQVRRDIGSSMRRVEP